MLAASFCNGWPKSAGGDSLLWFAVLGVALAVLLLALYLEAPGFHLDQWLEPQEQRPDETRRERLLRLARPLLARVDLSRLQQHLDYAGRPFGLTAEVFFLVRLLLSGGAALVLYLLGGEDWAADLVSAATASVITWLAVDGWLARRAATRQSLARAQCGDICALTAMALDAGKPNCSSALETVVTEMEGPLADELREALRDAKWVGFETAIQAVPERLPVEQVRLFCMQLANSNKHGSKAAQILRDMAEQQWHMDQAYIEERAGKLAAQMVIPMLVFIIGPMFGMILYLTSLYDSEVGF